MIVGNRATHAMLNNIVPVGTRTWAKAKRGFEPALSRVKAYLDSLGTEASTELMNKLKSLNEETVEAKELESKRVKFKELCDKALGLIPKVIDGKTIDNTAFITAYRDMVDHKVTNGLGETDVYNAVRKYHKQLVVGV